LSVDDGPLDRVSAHNGLEEVALTSKIELASLMSRALSGQLVPDTVKTYYTSNGFVAGSVPHNALIMSQAEIREVLKLCPLSNVAMEALVAAASFPSTFPNVVRQVCPE